MTDIGITTIFGAGVGFEILTRADFESIEHDAQWALMLNLLFFRITVTKY